MNFKNISIVNRDNEQNLKLSITSNSTLLKIEEHEIISKFKDIKIYDFYVKTHLIGYEELNLYDSCPNCGKKITGSLKCINCNCEFNINKPKHDFRVKLCIEMNENDVHLTEITAFSKHFDFTDNCFMPSLELNKLCEKECEFEFDSVYNKISKTEEYIFKKITY